MNNITEKDKEQRWDKIHSKVYTRQELKLQYDGWLECNEVLKEELNSKKAKILDLGCGLGIDTLHLVELGHDVIATDFSYVALEKIKENMPEVTTIQFNMKEDFPFDSKCFEFVVANKSIHYFSKNETIKIINEIHRILKDNGIFAFVVNSTNDSNFGAGQGIQIEENFYEVRETTKRFFNESDLKNFLKKDKWELIYMEESVAKDSRVKVFAKKEEKALKKVTWTCIARKII